MVLSNDLISQFVKATKDDKKVSKETTMYGTVVYDGRAYVKLDGSDLLTPVSTTAGMQDGERVTVLIKDHTAIVTGNVSSPAARTGDVQDVVDEISEFEILMAYKISTDELTAINASIESLRVAAAKITDLETVTALIESLEAKYANLEYVTAEDVEALNADIENLQAIFGEFENVSTEDLEAVNAEIENLTTYNANFTYVSADKLTAIKANVDDLEVKKLSAEDADLKYVNIDFSNIDKAWMDEFYANSGLIENVVMGDGTVTGYLVGVTIKGSLIEGDTIVADKLVIKGEDGLYYKLNTNGVTTEAEQTEYNSLNGKIITAKSITATQISVDDLVAFDATIGGFHITEHSIYSGVKESVDNTTQGTYLDSDGQMALGDASNFIKYYKDPVDGSYKLHISAESILFSSGANVADILDYIQIDPQKGSITLGGGKNAMSLTFDNDKISFQKNGNQFGWWDGVDFHTGNIRIDVTERAQFGNFAFVPRSDGSLSFLKIEHNSGFYAILDAGGIMIMYGAYPRLEETTMIIDTDEVSGRLDGTTLILGGE